MTPRPPVHSRVPIPGGGEGAPLPGRADIVLSGIRHGGPSFELRVFVNNPEADARTATVPDEGYAGSVYVYGYGIPPPGREEIAMTRYLVATDAIQAASAIGSSAAVTLVPVSFNGTEQDVDLSNVEVSLRIHDDSL